MKAHIFYDKKSDVVYPNRIASFITQVNDFRRAGFRKGFAIKLAARSNMLGLETAKEIWKRRDTWLKKGR